MEFDLFDTDALTELTTMLENVNMGRGDNGSTSSGGSTSSSTGLSGDSLENLQGSSIWSPTAHNSPSSNSSNSYTGGTSPPGSRSFEGSIEGPWSPGYHHNSSGNSSFICTTPPEKPFQEGANSSNNSWSPSSPLNTSNSSSAYSFPSSPPGLGLLNSIANNTTLSTKQTLQCLSLIQEFREQAQGNQWDTGRAAPGNTALTEALQQHLIALLLKQQPPPTPPGPIPTSPITPTPPGYHYGNNINSSNHHAHNNNHHQNNHHNINHHHHHDNIHRSLRFSHGSNETKCTWSGQLPPRNHTKPIYSCKVFLGGVPYEVSMNALQRTFRAYGNVKIEWPGKEDNPPDPKGYAYLIYENERQVKALLQNCVYQYGKENNWYYKISSKHMRFNCKDVQVIPWALSDSNYVRVQTTKLDPQKTIFVGALHGMINAEGLALIMQELFGGVVYAGIDTDRHKYPIGSARVTFNNHKSFMKAVSAAFVEIRTSKFTKKVQVDPYLEDATCSVCRLQQGPYFCRDLSCFRYFCRTCFEIHHTGESFKTHRPLMRNANRQQQNTRLPSSTASLSMGTSMAAPGCC